MGIKFLLVEIVRALFFVKRDCFLRRLMKRRFPGVSSEHCVYSFIKQAGRFWDSLRNRSTLLTASRLAAHLVKSLAANLSLISGLRLWPKRWDTM